MAVCAAVEDAISICSNAFSRLLRRFNLDGSEIGRIEVGSESNPDRAKAIKSHLIGLIGKLSISGGDNVQACYGGTAALLNSVAWLESSQWEAGKYAVVVAGDVAIYNAGAARATGGAGAVAILLARAKDAPIKIEKVFGHYATHVYDFYKPDPFCEYPTVDGPLSITAYLQSALHSYSDWHRKESSTSSLKSKSDSISQIFHQLIFHSPYSKIVYKAFCQLELFDPAHPIKIKNLTELSVEQKGLLDVIFEEKVAKNLGLSKKLGNSYCASIFFNLISTLMNLIDGGNCGKSRIGAFSYGSGSMATFFSFQFDASVRNLDWIRELTTKINCEIDSRIKITPAEYEKLMGRRKEMFGISNWTASDSDLKDLSKGTIYLSKIDSEYRRIYSEKQ